MSLVLLRLGDGDAQNAVLEASTDSVVLNQTREVEAARELANAALGEPVPGLVGGLLGSLGLGLFLFLGGHDFIARLALAGLVFVLNSRLVRVSAFRLGLFSDSLCGRSVFDGSSG